MVKTMRKDVAVATLVEAATHELRELIIQGELRPSEHIREHDVCERLGMSRTPVRAAFGNLALEGYLVHQPNRGYFVREFELRNLQETWDVRSVLEGLAARKCAEHGLHTEHEQVLRDCVMSGDAILGRGMFERSDVEPYRLMNMTFHETILQASRVQTLPGVIKATQSLPFVSERILIWQDFDHLKRSHDDHHRVLEAILSREGSRAEYLMREHVYYAGIFVSNHIAKNGFTHLISES